MEDNGSAQLDQDPHDRLGVNIQNKHGLLKDEAETMKNSLLTETKMGLSTMPWMELTLTEQQRDEELQCRDVQRSWRVLLILGGVKVKQSQRCGRCAKKMEGMCVSEHGLSSNFHPEMRSNTK